MSKHSKMNFFLLSASAFLFQAWLPCAFKGVSNSNSFYSPELFPKLHSDVEVWAVLFFLQSETQKFAEILS